MNYLVKTGFCILTLGLTVACSPEPVRPYVEEFTGAVSTASSSTDRKFSTMRLDDQLDALRREQLAQGQALYLLEGCTPLEPTAVDFAKEPEAFETHCQMSPVAFDPASEQLVETTVTPPEGDPRVEARNARNLVRALGDYATALQDLLDANSRSETAAAASSALKAIGGFVAEGSDRRDTPKLFTRETQGLVAGLTDELLEAYRYRLLKQVVTNANPSVQDASRAIAAWLSQTSDNARVEQAYRLLEETNDAAMPGSPQDLAQIEAAYENAKNTETSTDWRVYWEIAAAHAAIANSFAKPADFERLKAANDRILTLAETVKEFQDQ